MKKRILAIVFAVTMIISLAGCTKEALSSGGSSSLIADTSSIEPEVSEYMVNPLTGVENMKKSALKLKPVAIMINNITTAWDVQASLSKADVVYETYVEGGITRLMAVYKDIRTVGKNKIGSLRSGRYSYVDLAAGHGAQFVHAGLDDVYCRPHISEVGITSYDLNTTASSGNVIGGNNCAQRINNGKSYEHTLYTTGNDLYKALKSDIGLKLSKEQDNWMNFVAEGAEYTPADGTAKEIYVPFSGSYSAEFKYDESKKTYYKYRYGSKQPDYYNSDLEIKFENILVLYSTISYFPDGKHVSTDLSSGKGYYISNGGYREINWEKGSASSSFKLTDSSGAEIDYNPGKTYVCLTNSSNKSATEIS